MDTAIYGIGGAGYDSSALLLLCFGLTVAVIVELKLLYTK